MTDFEVLSFDCYGTLIDWESGILAALQPLLDRAAAPPAGDGVLEAYARAESAREIREPNARYSELLRGVCADLAREWGVEGIDAECAAFAGSVGDWPAFPDSAPALKRLQRSFRLVVLSNVDRVSFAGSRTRLGIEFDAVYTAEEIGSYKPDPRNFEYLIERVRSELGHEPSRILHVAQSLYHDHAPASRAGLATAWIDRRHGRPGSGATPLPPPGTKTDFRFPSLEELARSFTA